MSNNLLRNLDNCLKCSTCHTQCPVVANNLNYPGPKHLGPELERIRISFGQEETAEVDKYLAYCTNCKRCDIACPNGVRPSYYNLMNKAKITKDRLSSTRDWVLAHNVWWGKMASIVPGIANLALKLPITKYGMGLMGVAKRDFPQYKQHNIRLSNKKSDKKVIYFTGCYANFYEPEIIQATVDILEACNYQVEIAPVDCCGTPMFSNGLLEESKALANKNIDNFIKSIENGYKLITSCSSCGLAFKEEYADLTDHQDVLLLAQNTWDLFELLVEEDSLPFARNKAKYERMYYHIPCHLRAQGVAFPALQVLRDIGLEVVLGDDYCCGISGTYGFKKEKYELSLKIGAPLFKSIRDSQCQRVITDCGTCKLQINQNVGIDVKHPVVILREFI